MTSLQFSVDSNHQAFLKSSHSCNLPIHSLNHVGAGGCVWKPVLSGKLCKFTHFPTQCGGGTVDYLMRIKLVCVKFRINVDIQGRY